MGKKNKKKKRKERPQLTPTPPAPPPKKGLNIWKVIGLLASITTIILAWPAIKKEFFTSSKEQYEQETFEEGVLHPPLIQESNKYLISENPIRIINHAKPGIDTPEIKGILIKDFDKTDRHLVFVSGFIFTCLTGDFYKGVDLFNPIFNSCNSSHLILGVKDNRLYVSVEFKDLQNEQTIGIIEYNHWKLYKPNLFDFRNDDERLEVIDKQNNIVFSIKYDGTGVWISGYFIGNSSIIVMPNDPTRSKSVNPFCVQKSYPEWKQKALEEISVIKSIF